MKRVVIVGCPGAGKTTFSKKLTEKTGLPVIHLDYYFHQADKDYEHNEAAWTELNGKLAKQDAWIMEGNYNATLESRLKEADMVFFFDFSRFKSMYGVLKRRLHYNKKHREEMPEDWVERINFQFLLFVWRFRTVSRTKTVQLIRYSKKPTTVFTSHRQSNQYIEQL